MTDHKVWRRDKQEPEPNASHGRVTRASTVTTITVIAAVAIFLYLIRRILLPFVLAGVLAYVCTPVVDWLAARTRSPRWLFAVIVLLMLMALATLLGLLGIPALLEDIGAVAGDLQGTVARLAHDLIGDRTFNLIGEPIDAAQIAAHTIEALREWFDRSGAAFALVVWSVAGLSGFLLVWVLLGYFLVDLPRIARGVCWLVPPEQRPFVSRVWSELDPLLRRYFIGVALVIAYASTVAYVGLGLVLGLRHALLLALLTGLLEVLPLIGPLAAAIIAGLAATQQATSGWNILAYVAYATVLRLSIDQFFGPIVLGRASRLRPVSVIFCFLSGGILFGTVGVILAVPVALGIKVVLATLYNEPHT
jgi:predicted PurR-regulated permease PerM